MRGCEGRRKERGLARFHRQVFEPAHLAPRFCLSPSLAKVRFFPLSLFNRDPACTTVSLSTSMAAVSSPYSHQFMASSFPSAASSSTAFPSSSTTSSAPVGYSQSAAVDDEDLLALLGSDTFSLESARDRDLGMLQSFLQGVLPGTQPNHPTPPPHPGLAFGQAAGASAGWNGWRPSGSADGAAAPYGSPMSFSSTAGGPSAPSSSLNTTQHFPSPAQQAFLNLAPSPSPFSTNSQLAPSPRRGSLSSRGRAAHTAGQSMQAGYRAPAVSRERGQALEAAPPSSSGAAEGAENQGWKTRLRSARQAAQQHDEDAMME